MADYPAGINPSALKPRRPSQWPAYVVSSVMLVAGVGILIALANRPIETTKRSPLKGPGGVLLSERYGEPADTQTKEVALNLSREMVRKAAKWPDDAEFVGEPSIKVHSKWDCGYEIRGKVKLANGFGAHLTHDYTVQVALHDVPKHDWRCHLVMVGNEIVYSE
jgi:hypothetical protein